MHHIMESSKLCYSTSCLLLARLLSLLIFVYCLLFFAACRENSTKQVLTTQNQLVTSDSAIDINSASAAELEKLPGIGNESAQRIIEHREKYGAFRRVENLILVRGMSDKKYREIRSFVKVH